MANRPRWKARLIFAFGGLLPLLVFVAILLLAFRDDSDTILAIEIAESGIHWMEPGDLAIDQVPESITQGVEGYGVHVLFANASVWMLRPDVPLEDLKNFFTIEGAKRYDRDEVRGPGLVHLRGLPRLEELSLDNTSLADTDLQYLAGLDNLVVLSLEGTGVTSAGIRGLQAKKLRTALLSGQQVASPGDAR